MQGNRRELPLSKVAGHRRAVPRRACDGWRCGWTHPLRKAERVDDQVLLSGRSVAIAQTNPGELAGAGDDDRLVCLAAAGHPLPALVEPLLPAPSALDHRGVLAAVASG